MAGARQQQQENATQLTVNGSVVTQQRPTFDTNRKIAALHHTQRLHMDQLSIATESCITACTIIHDHIKDSIRQFIHDTMLG
eukprot:UN07994